MLNVYKFGGGVLNDIKTVNQVAEIVSLYSDNVVIVVSAMAKTTEKLEQLLECYIAAEDFSEIFNEIYIYHKNIIDAIFPISYPVYDEIHCLFKSLESKLQQLPTSFYDKEYDEIVSYGERFSAVIVSMLLRMRGLSNMLLSAFDVIKTDNNHRAANVDLEQTSKKIKSLIDFKDNRIYVLSGFIGSDADNIPTTLGKEGSDYTAALVANILDASELTLWKDVDGILNADPKMMSDCVKLNKVSYREATELACYGAKIIHHKTTKPLIAKNIKLHVRSFHNYCDLGTIVGDFEQKIEPLVPIFIYKKNQMLLTITSHEMEFISQNILHEIFVILMKYNIKINLLQNSALNLSLCFDINKRIIESLLSDVAQKFNYKYNLDLTLINIRHYTQEAIDKTIITEKIKLEQKDRMNAFYLVEI